MTFFPLRAWIQIIKLSSNAYVLHIYNINRSQSKRERHLKQSAEGIKKKIISKKKFFSAQLVIIFDKRDIDGSVFFCCVDVETTQTYTSQLIIMQMQFMSKTYKRKFIGGCMSLLVQLHVCICTKVIFFCNLTQKTRHSYDYPFWNNFTWFLNVWKWNEIM